MSVVKGIAKVDFYYAKFLNTTNGTYGRPTRVYDTPILLSFNIKPTTDKFDFSLYGERVTRMLRANKVPPVTAVEKKARSNSRIIEPE